MVYDEKRLNWIINSMRNTSLLYDHIKIKEVINVDNPNIDDIIRTLSYTEQLYDGSVMQDELVKYKMLYYCNLYQRLLLQYKFDNAFKLGMGGI
jgi:hypothetical protein